MDLHKLQSNIITQVFHFKNVFLLEILFTAFFCHKYSSLVIHIHQNMYISGINMAQESKIKRREKKKIFLKYNILCKLKTITTILIWDIVNDIKEVHILDL